MTDQFPSRSPQVFRLVYRPETAGLILNVGIAVAQEMPADAADAERLYVEGKTQTRRTGVVILAAGPILDGPDAVAVGAVRWNRATVDVEARHTSASLSGKDLLRNMPWRPIVAVPAPAELAPGEYNVVVRWQAVTALQDGKALAAPLPIKQTFTVR